MYIYIYTYSYIYVYTYKCILTKCMFTGFTNAQWSAYISRRESLQRWRKAKLPKALEIKAFKPVHDKLPILGNYKGDKDDSYWSHWEKRKYEELTPATSWICPNKLFDVARDLNYIDYNGYLSRTMESLCNGANIGCEGDG